MSVTGIAAEDVGPMVVVAIREGRFPLLPDARKLHEALERKLAEIERVA